MPSVSAMVKLVEAATALVAELPAQGWGRGHEDLPTLGRQAVTTFENAAIALSLQAAESSLRRARASAVAAGAVDEAGAMWGPGGQLQLFAVPDLGKNCAGLAIIAGQHRFLVTLPPEGPGYSIAVVRWQPDLAEADMARLAPWADDPGQLTPQEVVRAALRLAAFARPGSQTSLEDTVGLLRTSQLTPEALRVGTLRVERSLRRDRLPRLLPQCPNGLPGFFDFADAIRPLLDLPQVAPAGRPHVPSALASMALDADGGFLGEHCRMASSLLRQGVRQQQFSAMAEGFAALADHMEEAGFIGPHCALSDDDDARLSFVVPGADPGVMGRYHLNATLTSAIDAHMVVTRRGPDGRVERIEVHPCHRPVETLSMSNGWQAARLVLSLGATASACADEHASPPRLTLAMLVDRLVSGQPLPPPAGGYDCRSRSLLPGTAENCGEVISQAIQGYLMDRAAMARQLPELGIKTLR